MNKQEEIKKAKSFAPTEAMKNNAKRGLALREKYKRGGLDASQAKSEGVGSGVARARDISNGSLSLDTVKRMYAFFSRHEKNYNPKKKEADGGPTAGTIAWLLWGGSAGLAWSRKILREQDILKSYTSEITEKQLSTEDAIPLESIQVAKSLDEELKQVTYVCMRADSTDEHGDYTSANEVRKAADSFRKAWLANQKLTNLFHLYKTSSFDIIESFLSPSEMSLNGHYVNKSDWLVTLQINDDKLWDAIKSGDIVGVSIGAKAKVIDLEESDD